MEWSARFPGVARLLVAAIADEKAGVENGVAGLVSWLTDAGRFPASWIGAVHATIQVARKSNG